MRSLNLWQNTYHKKADLNKDQPQSNVIIIKGGSAMAVACGDRHTLMAIEGKAVFACGRGDFGQLGGAGRADQRVPAPVRGLEEMLAGGRVVMVAAAKFNSAACTSDGEVLTWGAGGEGQLGHGDRDHRAAPAKLGIELFKGSPVKMVSCGGFHTMALTSAGKVFTFGCGGNGRLGHGDTSTHTVPCQIPSERFLGASIAYVCAGYCHSAAVTWRGGVWTWGWGGCGQLGHNDERDQLVPKELLGQFGRSKVVMVSAGNAHTMALTDSEGHVWGWGLGANGRLGLGNITNSLTPARVSEPSFCQSKALMVDCGDAHTMAVTEEGELWSWGWGSHGKLGHGDRKDQLVPVRVDPKCFDGAKVATASCGTYHSSAVTQDGRLFTWGWARDYEKALHLGLEAPAGLGHEDLNDKLVPSLVVSLWDLGAHVGCFLRLPPLHALAFAMGTHERLGAGGSDCDSEGYKGCEYLAFPGELIRRMVEISSGWDDTVERKGLMRLQGCVQR